MRCPGLHMAPQSGVPLKYIKCITFSQRAGWGPSHSLSPPVPLSFSVTSLLPLLILHWGGQAWLLPVTAEVGEVLRCQGAAGLTEAWHPSALSGGKSAVPPGEGLRVSLVRNPKLRKEFSFFNEAGGCTEMGRPCPYVCTRGCRMPGAHWDRLLCQVGCPALGSCPDRDHLYLLVNLGLEDRKILLLKQGNSRMRNRV